MPEFIPALELAEKYYHQLVRPLLDANFPGLPHAAALIGYGSEVLGFDTPMSMDHCWAPRMQLFLPVEQLELSAQVDDMLRKQLPTHFLGFPLGTRASPEGPAFFFMDDDPKAGEVNHRVQIISLPDFTRQEMGWDMCEQLVPADWLSFSSQILRAMTAGRVFYDNHGQLTQLRRQLAYYPQQVWLYLLSSGWDRIGQEDALMQRAGFVEDELGSALMGSRLVRDIMSLCFLMEKQYAPYPKWFGTAFKKLTCAVQMSPVLWQVQVAATWQERAAALGAACELLVQKHNQLGLTQPMPEKVSSFHGRPFMVIQAENISSAIVSTLTDPEVMRIAKKGLLGGLDQFSDNTILRSDPQWRQALKGLFV
ncbi:MAG: DUF4037 domain-containing protein [Chloroflexota bacterium]